jgi:hypothetical protein
VRQSGSAVQIQDGRVRVPYAPHHGGQVEFHQHGHVRTRVLACGRRWGKDRSVINEMMRVASRIAIHRVKYGTGPHVLVPLVHVWVVAPDYPRLKQWWRELKQFIPKPFVVSINETDRSIELSVTRDGAPHILIELKSSVKPDSLVSVGLDVLVITEASLVPERAWSESLLPCLASPGRCGIAILNGTPKGRNWFKREFDAAKQEMLEFGEASDAWAYQAPTLSNPYIDPKWYKRIAARMPRRKRRQELEAVFLGAEDSYFPDARKRLLPDSWDLVPPIIVGVDWGRTDNPTVYLATDVEGHMLGSMKIKNRSFSHQFEQLHVFVDQLPAVDRKDIIFVPDATSMQSALAERIVTEFGIGVDGGPDIVPIRMTGPLKQEIMDALAFDLEEGNENGLWLQDHPELLNQIELFEEGDLRNTRQVRRRSGDDFDDHHFDHLVALAQLNWVRRMEGPIGGGGGLEVGSC